MKLKQIMLLVLPMLIAAGCAKDVIEEAPAGDVSLVLDASFDHDATKTAYDGGKVSWTAGDVVRYYSADGRSASSSVVDQSGDNTRLRVEVGSSDSYLVAATGAASITSCTTSGFRASGTVMSSQSGRFGDAHLAVARMDDLSSETILFRNVTSFVKFSLSRADVAKVVISSLSGSTIATKSDLDVAFADGDITLNASSSSSSVTVATSGAGTYYAALLPGTMSKGFKIQCYDASGSYLGNAAYSKSVSLPAATMVNLGTLDSRLRKSISILAIGNSFSSDAMEYLYPMLRQAGYDEIVLGNLYIGGCTLQTHSGNLGASSASYTYYANTSGSWSSTSGAVANTAISSRAWDYVSIQQASGWSGMPDSYEPYLGNIIAYVNAHCPSAQIMWHMTWAYQGNSTHSDFGKYGSSQETMYNAIISTVKSRVLAHPEIGMVIPCGTAVQNLRTSFLGDTITRDGYHMSYDVGRFVTALMWTKQISGCDLSKITYTPAGYSYTDRKIGAIKEAVDNAYADPYKVIASTYVDEALYNIPDAALRSVFTSAGYKLSDYDEMIYRIYPYAYYNSSSNSISTIIDEEHGSTAANLVQFSTTPVFSRAQLPIGTVLVLKSGFQYRPEAWTNLSSKNTSATRPGNVTDNVVVIDGNWWGSWNYRAFNLAKAGNPSLSASEQEELRSCFGIYVPRKDASETTDAILAKAGYQVSNYRKLSLELTKNAYYYSSSANFSVLLTSANSTAANLNQFSATRIFTRSDIPVGSVIVLKNGFQYRPEGWIDMSTKNTSSTRPGNVTTQVVEVNSSWWGSWNYRAFNLAQYGNPSLTDAQQDELADCFAIYVPR